MRRGLLALTLALTLGGCGDDAAGGDQPIVIDEGAGSEAPGPDENEVEPDTEPPASGEGLVMSDEACETDADCVPAACCHASACVAVANRPDCSETMCTADCRFGTLDCGGACLCHEGRCAARLSEAQPPRVVQ